jgi:predicted alpha/beta-fold hydrolase
VATLSGHLWTIAPNLAGRLRPSRGRERVWATSVGRRQEGERRIRLVGWISDEPGLGREELVVLVHGLGGDADSPYVRDAAQSVRAAGYASLRVSMRGAGSSQPDFYHAGLGSDLVELLEDPSLKSYERVFLIGFSMGGHLALHAALDPELDDRVVGVAAVCSPLDLPAGATYLDAPRGFVYRRHILRGLESTYREVEGQRRIFRTIREFDAATIVPRYGFASVEDYWRSQSVGPRLADSTLPTLFLAAEGDPVVPAATLRPHLQRARESVDVRWVRRGGHVGFPPDLDLGVSAPSGLLPQILGWRRQL